MNRKKFNEAMIQFFNEFGGEGMAILRYIFRSKSNIILYQAMLSGKPIAMSDVMLSASSAHRAKNVLMNLSLIKPVGLKLDWSAKGGAPPELWQLVLDGNTSTKK